MKNQKTKAFEINNEKYRFNKYAFNEYFKSYFKKNRDSIDGVNCMGDFEEYFAQKIKCSQATVHGWRFGNSGPGDLDLIEEIAQLLEISDYMNLMMKGEKMSQEKLESAQAESFKRTYDAIIEYLNDFKQTDGFTGELWCKFRDMGYEGFEIELEIYRYAEDKVDAVLVVLQKEYFYLHDTTLYDELYEYVNNDLNDIFDGKLSYAYRFEAITEGHPTTEDDYNKALSGIQDIVKRYN